MPRGVVFARTSTHPWSVPKARRIRTNAWPIAATPRIAFRQDSKLRPGESAAGATNVAYPWLTTPDASEIVSCAEERGVTLFAMPFDSIEFAQMKGKGEAEAGSVRLLRRDAWTMREDILQPMLLTPALTCRSWSASTTRTANRGIKDVKARERLGASRVCRPRNTVSCPGEPSGSP